MCADTLKEYGRLVSESPKLLYSLRCSVVYNGYLGGQKYFLDISRADIKYPVQTQPFVNGKPAYGNMLIDVGVIAARLYTQLSSFIIEPTLMLGKDSTSVFLVYLIRIHSCLCRI